MCCVLVDQHEPVGIFHQNVKLAQDTDDLELVPIAIAFGWNGRRGLMRFDNPAGVIRLRRGYGGQVASGYSNSNCNRVRGCWSKMW